MSHEANGSPAPPSRDPRSGPAEINQLNKPEPVKRNRHSHTSRPPGWPGSGYLAHSSFASKQNRVRVRLHLGHSVGSATSIGFSVFGHRPGGVRGAPGIPPELSAGLPGRHGVSRVPPGNKQISIKQTWKPTSQPEDRRPQTPRLILGGPAPILDSGFLLFLGVLPPPRTDVIKV